MVALQLKKKTKKKLHEAGNENGRSARHPVNCQMLCKSHGLVLMVCNNKRLPVASRRKKYTKNTGPLLQFVKMKLKAFSCISLGTPQETVRGVRTKLGGQLLASKTYQYADKAENQRT